MCEQRDRPELDDIARFYPASKLFDKIVSERDFHMVGGDLQPIDLRQCAEGRRSRHEKIPEQPWIGRGRRRHLDEEAVEGPRYFTRELTGQIELDAARKWIGAHK